MTDSADKRLCKQSGVRFSLIIYYYLTSSGTSFLSVLVEMGFVSNNCKRLLMANSANQDNMADAIANGVYEYFARSGL